MQNSSMANFPTILIYTTLCAISMVTAAAAAAAAAALPSSSSTDFIESKCRSTTYPTLCIQSLAPYASVIKQDPCQLARTAMLVSSTRAQSTKTFVTRLAKMKGLKKREIAAVKDCVDEMSDTIDRLKMAVGELNLIKGKRDKDFQWHISNVETWMSAALTDENTCVDGFAGSALNGRIKESIKARIVNVAQLTSNALALVNQYAGN